MKTLYLVRHAKSSWERAGLTDEERPLLPGGIEKTKKIVGFLVGKGIKPDLIISSHAVRAYETAKILAKGIGFPPEKIMIERGVYEGPYDRILDVIYGTAGNINSLMIVGHNPTITGIVNLFLHPGIEDMRTSAVASITFDTEKWEEIPSKEAKMEFFIYPRMLT
jgi:phosphohistidine phosphatase